MGTIRTGARTYLNILAKACKLSRTPGFRTGVIAILGVEEATPLLAAWDTLCAIIDALIGADNWYNQIDTVNDDGTGEDAPVME